MRSFSKKLAFVLAAAMVVTAFAPAAKAEAASEMAINKQDKILYVTDGKGINDAAQVGGGKGNVSVYDFSVKNKPADWKTAYSFAWSSSDEDVVTVGKGGVTTAVGVGEATVYCKVTNKATKEVTTLKTDVTVKANAAKVVITNAEDWADLAYEVGDVIDLNRTMYDAKGVKAPKRGVVVTDYTRWMAEPSTGVKIDSSKGTFEFTEEAEAGEYTLWCETYQSKKYTDTTAKSDVIKVVLVKDNAFTVTQNSLNQVTINFDSAVEALAKADVTVQKIRVANGKEYFSKMTVKGVTLNDAKDAATVDLFNALEDGTNYKITVKGTEEAFVLAATAGKPNSIMVTAQVDGKDVEPLTTGQKATLACKFYDENGVDVTAAGYKVTYSLVEYSKNGGYTLSGSNLTIKKAGEVVGVKAKYQGWLENGKMVGEIVETFYFTAEDAAPIYAVGVADFSLNNWAWYGNKTTVKLSEKDVSLLVKVTTDDGKTTKEGLAAGADLPTSVGAKQTLSFTAVNPEICSIAGGKLVPYKTGVAEFYVNTVTPQTGGKPALVEPFDSIYIEVVKDSEFASFSLDKYDVTVGVVDKYDEETITLKAVDQYGADFDADVAKVEGVSENAKAILDAIKANGGLVVPTAKGAKQEIKINGMEILDALQKTKDYQVGEGDVAYLEFKVKANNYEQYFNVLVQNEGAKDDRYVSVGNNGVTDALRVVDGDDSNKNAENAKTLTFTAYLMSGNIKVGTQNFSAYPADVTTVSAQQYFYKVTKDGKDVAHEHTGSGVEIALSGLDKAASGSAIAGNSIVNYTNLGEGAYTFELYYSYTAGELTQIDVSTCVVTVGDKGAYTLAAQTANAVTMTSGNYYEMKAGEFCATDKAAIAACFTFNGRDGKKIEDMSKVNYDVKYDATKGTNSVYVESVHFYEEVTTGEYVEYVVPVNVVLVRK